MLTESDLSAIEAMLIRLLDERLPKKREKREQPDVPTDAFEAFWDAYPKVERKVAKAQCLAKWRSQGCDRIADQVMRGLENSKRSIGWNKPNGEFIPAPLVWLNQARWTAPSPEESSAVAAPKPAPRPELLMQPPPTEEEKQARAEAARRVREAMRPALKVVGG